ncbi:MAG: ABC transporter permease [Coraliomargarita sp.]
MRHFFILLKHELRMLLISPTSYIAGFFFYTIMGLMYWRLMTIIVAEPQDDLPSVEFFKFFWLPTLFVVPLLTMKSIAGERSSGTLDTLMTTPASRVSIILSKFAGAYLFYVALWVGTLTFPFIMLQAFPHVAGADALLAAEAVLGGLSFIALSGILFISVGIFASTITRSQLVAGMLTFTALFMAILGGNFIASVEPMDSSMLSWTTSLADYLQIFEHLEDFTRGVIDTRPFFYYTSTGIVLLGLSTLVIEAKA